MRRARARASGTALFALGALLLGASTSAAPRDSVASDFQRLFGTAEKKEKEARQRLANLEREAKIVDGRLLARGRAYVRMARAGILPVGGGFDALVAHAARLERLRAGLERDMTLAKRLAAERIAVGRDLRSLEERRGALDAEREVIEQAETALRSAEERDRAFRQAFEAPAHTAVYGAGIGPSDPVELARGFPAQRGKLPFPIAGRITIRPATRPGADGPGLELRAPAGTAVQTVFVGRVAFADSYAEYGKTVIIDHGQRHYTVSANLAAIDVQVGDEVGVGQRIGTIGDGGLHVEIRVGRDTVDPSEWFGI